MTMQVMNVVLFLTHLRIFQIPKQGKLKHFHLICPLPCGSNTKIEKISILWGIVVSNFGLIYLKVKIGTKLCRQFVRRLSSDSQRSPWRKAYAMKANLYSNRHPGYHPIQSLSNHHPILQHRGHKCRHTRFHHNPGSHRRNS